MVHTCAIAFTIRAGKEAGDTHTHVNTVSDKLLHMKPIPQDALEHRETRLTKQSCGTAQDQAQRMRVTGDHLAHRLGRSIQTIPVTFTILTHCTKSQSKLTAAQQGRI